uniref:Uncharacterized protein n=1 Tax=Chromera velia CCMP2878 TaxID=1169474 RepID=A0A0G4HZP6_9ALVE|eukprot:Cvel_34045.t1-p1 / transcript=Cvel_34045.t1 / gene=Cvel_34045 / organism=Chromera_velia_CCMP2878 / gene_product=hypothetical protein / transcript_product=hypothetical protein / location=Cvel_scaffold5718:1641-1949(-) / protein_length=103 / sequence_SO=supercontig / SO=protein_coding / is_pseudo=false
MRTELLLQRVALERLTARIPELKGTKIDMASSSTLFAYIPLMFGSHFEVLWACELKEPSVFTGVGKDVQEWVMEMKAFLEGMGVSEDQKLLVAENYLCNSLKI